MFDFYRRQSQRLLHGEAAEVPAPAFIPRTPLQLKGSNTANKTNICAAATSPRLLTVPFCCCIVTAEITHTLVLFNGAVTEQQQPLWHTGAMGLSRELVLVPGTAFHLLTLLSGRETTAPTLVLLEWGWERMGAAAVSYQKPKCRLYFSISIKNWYWKKKYHKLLCTERMQN